MMSPVLEKNEKSGWAFYFLNLGLAPGVNMSFSSCDAFKSFVVFTKCGLCREGNCLGNDGLNVAALLCLGNALCVVAWQRPEGHLHVLFQDDVIATH